MPGTTRKRSAAGVSFCIITDGRRREQLRSTITGILAQADGATEVILSGDVPDELMAELPTSVRVVPCVDAAHTGRLGAMRNAACSAAQYDLLVVCDDDMRFAPDFCVQLRRVPRESYDVLCVRLLNPDGSRFWDWATFGGPRGHCLLDYDETDDHVYVTGGLAIMHAAVFAEVPWDDARGFYQAEDVEWSSRVRAAGFRIGFDPLPQVTHADARYTQHGRVLRFRQDLTSWERVIPGVEARGFHRPQSPGFRWMSASGGLLIAAQPYDTVLQFALTSAATALSETRQAVHMLVNEQPAGTFAFEGVQTCTAQLTCPQNQSLRLRLEASAVAPSPSVGLDDEHGVSVLLHDLKRITA